MNYSRFLIVLFLSIFCIKSRLLPSQPISDVATFEGTWVCTTNYEGQSNDYPVSIQLIFDASTGTVTQTIQGSTNPARTCKYFVCANQITFVNDSYLPNVATFYWQGKDKFVIRDAEKDYVFVRT